MTTIETTALIESNGNLTISLPTKIAPGMHKVVLVIQDETEDANDLTEEEKIFFQNQLQEVKEFPSGGSYGADVISRLEQRIGKKQSSIV